MAVPVEVHICMGGFLYTEAGNVLSDPGETKVSKKGVSPSLLGAMW